jgi:hypothetical protein
MFLLANIHQEHEESRHAVGGDDELPRSKLRGIRKA